MKSTNMFTIHSRIGGANMMASVTVAHQMCDGVSAFLVLMA